MSVRRGRRGGGAAPAPPGGFDFSALCGLLAGCGLEHSPVDEVPAEAGVDLARLNVELDAGVLVCSLVWHRDERCLELVGILPVQVPAERWPEVHLVLANRNRACKQGFFVLHPDFGQVWYRNTQLVADGSLTEGQLQGLLGHAVAAAEAMLTDGLGDLR